MNGRPLRQAVIELRNNPDCGEMAPGMPRPMLKSSPVARRAAVTSSAIVFILGIFVFITREGLGFITGTLDFTPGSPGTPIRWPSAAR